MNSILPILIFFFALLSANLAWSHQSHHSKVALINEQLLKQPNNQRLYIERGIEYSNDGEFDLALADYQKAQTLGDPIATAFHLGVLFYRKGEFDKAEKQFNDVLKYLPEHAQSLEYRARLRRDAGDYEGSIADYSAFFALHQRPNPGHYISAAKMLAAMQTKGITEALKWLDQGIEQLGLIPQLQRYAIELELQRNNIDGAIDRLYSLEQILGDTPNWQVEMAELQFAAGHPRKARELLSSAVQQLQTLRTTVARITLMKKIQGLQASWGSI